MLIANISNWEALEALQMSEHRLELVARAGAFQVLKYARKYAPKKTGALRRGIIVMPGIEKSRYVGKAVAEVVMDRAMNRVFQRPTPEERARGQNPKHHFYYPASQEYGFKRRVRGGGTTHVPGKHFMHVASRLEAPDMERMVVELVEDVLGEL